MNFVTKEPINKGWSSDKKYCVMKADFFPQFVENAGDCVKMVKMVLALPNEEAV